MIVEGGFILGILAIFCSEGWFSELGLRTVVRRMRVLVVGKFIKDLVSV